MNDKVAKTESQLATEQDAKEAYIRQFEEQQRLTISTKTALMEMKTSEQKARMDYDSARTNLETV